MKKRKLDIAVLSDLHLGTYGCHAKEVLQYLKSIKPDILILNGDIVDAWQFKKRYFPPEHTQILQLILKKAAKGMTVYYITGNHDDVLRRFSDFSMGNLHLIDKLVLNLKGKKYCFFHGDVFDASVKISPFIAKLGGKGYDSLIWLNRTINRVRVKFGMTKMSFSKKVKASVKKAVKYIGDFEDTAIDLAIDQGYDYVVCGHIHQAQLRHVRTKNGAVTYMNSGDWVESLTALELVNDKWSVFQYDSEDFQKVEKMDEELEAAINVPAKNFVHEMISIVFLKKKYQNSF